MTSPRHSELLDLSGKTAIVTGASQGIGASIARRFAEAGARLVVHYRSHPELALSLAASITDNGGEAVAAQAELTESSGVDGLIAQTLEALGSVDVLINNAGHFPTRPLLDMSLADWRAMYAANVETAFLCTQAAARWMKDRNGGAIVNIASIGALNPAMEHSHYGSAKAALLMFTRSAAQELAPYEIRVNAVSPGLVSRPGLEQQWPEGVRRWLDKALLKRLGQPSDVADACLFLACPASRWITGQNLIVDGGVTASSIY
jgi:NAD(P)-dependent dehydrogenase (short-subunit alcohol dehydrogenase family)